MQPEIYYDHEIYYDDYEDTKQARKSSEDAQAGYAQFEKVWVG